MRGLLAVFFTLFFAQISKADWEPVSFSANTAPPALNACECVGGIKDYDPAKGYYFGRVTGSGFSKTISARFACGYICKNGNDEFFRVSYVHEEGHPGGKSSGPQHAKWFICDNSIARFIPRYDLMGHLLYYDTEPYGAFDASRGPRPEFRAWAASQNCQDHSIDFFSL